MPPGYPGYTYLCPFGVSVPLTSWVAVIGSLAYGLWIEAALLALGLFVFWIRRSLPRWGILSALAVIAGALVASAADNWTAQRNAQLCVSPLIHATPEEIARLRSIAAPAIAQANIALAIAAAAFLIGTFLTVRILVLGCRGRRHARVAQAS
ncbi:MAG TPA: hypothetical protein VFQ25_13610 [Ktedonobacterales bacterium]|nr:hypothetical protein [Ktedonobacterales bacterium]